jgi:hypothetical protein
VSIRVSNKGDEMRRYASLAVLIAVMVGGSAGTATAQSNGGGNSGNAPGQEIAAGNCEKVWSVIQVDLVAGGGPKSELVDIGDPGEPFLINSGPTNCDHFWQATGVIGK